MQETEKEKRVGSRRVIHQRSISASVQPPYLSYIDSRVHRCSTMKCIERMIASRLLFCHPLHYQYHRPLYIQRKAILNDAYNHQHHHRRFSLNISLVFPPPSAVIERQSWRQEKLIQHLTAFRLIEKWGCIWDIEVFAFKHIPSTGRVAQKHSNHARIPEFHCYH